MSHFYDRAGNPITIMEAEALLTDPDALRVAHDPVVLDGEIIWISTVFTVVNYSLTGRWPMIFETMVFGGPDDLACWRYGTEEAALAGHAEVLARYTERVERS